MIGELLNNRYSIQSEIGRGGFGVVYRANDTLLEWDVAISGVVTAVPLLMFATAAHPAVDGGLATVHRHDLPVPAGHPGLTRTVQPGAAEGVCDHLDSAAGVLHGGLTGSHRMALQAHSH